MVSRVKPSIPLLVLFISFSCVALIPNFLKLSSDPRIMSRKTFMRAVNELAGMIPFESIHNDKRFVEFTEKLRAMPETPYLIIYDSSNLDVVFNHICNLKLFPNALSRLVGVSLDQSAHDDLQKTYPEIPSVVVDLQHLKKMAEQKENPGYLIYTLALMIHTRIISSLSLRGVDFWSMHQDTIWIKDFEKMKVEDRYPDANMVFDRIGNDDLPEYKRINEWFCAATFFVRACRLTYQFFQQVESYMLTHQSPESTVMTYLCGHEKYKCEIMPRWIASSIDYFKKPKEISPVLIQIDASKKNGKTKMDLLRDNDLVFRTVNESCDGEAVEKLKYSVASAFPENRVQENQNKEETWYQKVYFQLKTMFNVDPYNAKYFLKIHYHKM